MMVWMKSKTKSPALAESAMLVKRKSGEDMEKAYATTRMAPNMKDNGSMIIITEKEYIQVQLEKFN